jgi:hypothetical protein
VINKFDPLPEFESNVRASAMKIQADKSQIKRLFEADFVTYAAA